MYIRSYPYTGLFVYVLILASIPTLTILVAFCTCWELYSLASVPVYCLASPLQADLAQV